MAHPGQRLAVAMDTLLAVPAGWGGPAVIQARLGQLAREVGAEVEVAVLGEARDPAAVEPGAETNGSSGMLYVDALPEDLTERRAKSVTVEVALFTNSAVVAACSSVLTLS